jgi:cation diffusion facilitator CzcD-associated flavoprotein CzcO
MTSSSNPDRHALETLRLIGPDPENWVVERTGIDHNVLIVGGGQSGTALAFGLRRAGIGRVSVIDGAADESGAGVWLTRARMTRLRTPKSLVGPEVGLPALGFQAWFEARHGAEAYAEIERIPRKQWAEYLAWYRHLLGIPIRYGTTLTRIEPGGDHFRLHLSLRRGAQATTKIETARKIILANGVAGNGRPFVPAVLADLPPERFAHTSALIDFTALRGKTVAVLGGAASAFDAAATGLEAGASVIVVSTRARAYPGAYDNYYALPDALRWAQALRFRRAGSTPPPDAVERVTRFANFHLHTNAHWQQASVAGDRIEATVGAERFEFDYVIAGTGYEIDLHARPELADFAGNVLLWRDRYTPDAHEQDDALGAHPYLGAALEYLEKSPGSAPYLKNIHIYNPAAFVSFGLPVGDVPSMKRDIPAVIRRISQDLFLDDLDAHTTRINTDVPAEFHASFYAHRLWPTDAVASPS